MKQPQSCSKRLWENGHPLPVILSAAEESGVAGFFAALGNGRCRNLYVYAQRVGPPADVRPYTSLVDENLAHFQPRSLPLCCASHLLGGGVEAVEEVGHGDHEDQGRESAARRSAGWPRPRSRRAPGRIRSLSRVTASVSASAARSASVK